MEKTQINMSREEYIALRQKGLTQQQILELDKKAHKPEVKGFIETMANITDTIFGGGKIGDMIGTEIAKRSDSGKELARQEATGIAPKGSFAETFKGPSAMQVAGSGLRAASNFIPAAKGATLARAGMGAITGYAMDVGSNLEQGKTGGDALKPGAATVVGGALPGAASAASVLGKLSGLTGKALEEANMRLTPTEKQNLAQKGQAAIDWMTSKKVVGSPSKRLAFVRKAYDDMEHSITGLIAQNDGFIDKAQVREALSGIVQKYQDDPTALAQVEKAVTDFNGYLDKVGTKGPYANSIAISRLNDIKRNVFKRAFQNKEKVVNEAQYAVGDALYGVLETKVPGLREANAKYAPIITARKILQKAATRNQAGILTRAIFSAGGGAAGTALSGGNAVVGGTAGMLAGDKIAKVLATPIRSGAGAVATTLGDVLKKVPQDSNGNIPLKLLLQVIAQDDEGETQK